MPKGGHNPVTEKDPVQLIYGLLERGMPLTYLARILQVDKGYFSRLVRDREGLRRFLERQQKENRGGLSLLWAAYLDQNVFSALLASLIAEETPQRYNAGGRKA